MARVDPRPSHPLIHVDTTDMVRAKTERITRKKQCIADERVIRESIERRRLTRAYPQEPFIFKNFPMDVYPIEPWRNDRGAPETAAKRVLASVYAVPSIFHLYCIVFCRQRRHRFRYSLSITLVLSYFCNMLHDART